MAPIDACALSAGAVYRKSSVSCTIQFYSLLVPLFIFEKAFHYSVFLCRGTARTAYFLSRLLTFSFTPLPLQMFINLHKIYAPESLENNLGIALS